MGGIAIGLAAIGISARVRSQALVSLFQAAGEDAAGVAAEAAMGGAAAAPARVAADVAAVVVVADVEPVVAGAAVVGVAAAEVAEFSADALSP